MICRSFSEAGNRRVAAGAFGRRAIDSQPSARDNRLRSPLEGVETMRVRDRFGGIDVWVFLPHEPLPPGVKAEEAVTLEVEGSSYPVLGRHPENRNHFK